MLLSSCVCANVGEGSPSPTLAPVQGSDWSGSTHSVIGGGVQGLARAVPRNSRLVPCTFIVVQQTVSTWPHRPRSPPTQGQGEICRRIARKKIAEPLH